MNKFLSLLTTLTLSTALAHTAVSSITPALNAVVAAPSAVQLKFSEPVELRFSTFRVMAVPAGQTVEAAAKLALAERADSDRLASLPLTATTMAAQLNIPLNAGLRSGQYVIAWKILSEGGHPVTGQSTFRVK
ncbi:copper resistance protein [Deinococcus indicus]|uniref:copper resistance CopC family protein n=1 Tax=Deinococcus indicus TaxID=223556 RepID=UPI0017498360|nr:copper resistance CopC family protein [Deinococcus indicus]GHG40565.1 copper resistance protein [Deinococcus indicus]